MAAQPIAEAAVRIVADTAELEAALKSAEKAFTSFVAKWVSIGAAAKEVFDALMEQERALRLVSAEMGLGREAAMAYVQSIDRIRVYWGFAREEAVRAATNIADAGYTAAESASILEEAMKLAGSTGASLANVADVLASTMRAYNLSAHEATRAAENLFYILAAGRVTLEDLDLGFHRLLVVARPLGIALEELTASYTVMSQKTTETYNIYLALMGVIKAMINPTKRLQEILLEHGFASGLAALKSLGLLGVMRLLWGEIERGHLSFRDIISDIRAVSGLASITTEDIEKMAQAFESLRRGQTGYHEATQAFTESFIRQWNQVKESLKLAAAGIATILLPALQGLLDILNSLIGVLRRVLEFELRITGVRITGQDEFKKAASTLQVLALLALPFLGRKFAFGAILQWFIPVMVTLEISKILARSTASPASTAEVILRSIVAALGAALAYAGIYTGKIALAAGGIAISIGGQLILNLVFKPTAPVDISKVLEEQVFKPFRISMEELNQKVQEIAGRMTVEITPRFVGTLPLPPREIIVGLHKASRELEERFAEIKKEHLTPEVYKALGFVFGKAMTDAFFDFETRMQALAEAINRNLQIGIAEWDLRLSKVPTEFWAAFAYAQSTTLDVLAARLAELGVEIQLITPREVPDFRGTIEAYLEGLTRALEEVVSKFSESLAGRLIDGILTALAQGQETLEEFIARVGGIARTIGIKAVFELIEAIDAAVKEIDKYEEVLGSLPPEYEETRRALISLRESIVGVEAPISIALSSFRAQLEGVDFGGLAAGLWDVIDAISGMKDVDWIVTLLRSEIEVRKEQPAQILALSNAILTLLERLREAAATLEGWGIEVPEKIRAGIAALSTFEKTTSLETELLKARFRGLQQMLYERISAELEAGKSVDEVVRSLRVLAASVADNPAALQELADTAVSLQKQLEEVVRTYNLALQPVPKRLQESLDALTKFTKAMEDSAEDLIATFRKARLPDLQERLLRLLVAVISYHEVQEQAAQSLAFLRNVSSETSTFLYDFARSVLQVSSSAESSGAVLGLSLSQLSFTVERSAENLSLALDSVATSSRGLSTSLGRVSAQLPTILPTVTVPPISLAAITTPAIVGLSEVIDEISAKINQTALTLTGLSQTIVGLPGLFTNLLEHGAQLTLGLSFLQIQSADLSTRIAMVAAELERLGETARNLGETARQTARDLFTRVLAEAWGTLMEGARRGADAAERALMTLAEKLAKEAEGEGVNIAPLLELIDVSRGLRDALTRYLDFVRAKQIPISEDLKERLEAARVALSNFLSDVEDSAELLRRLQNAIEEAINSIARAMGIEIPSSVSYAISALLGIESFEPIIFAIKAAVDLVVFSLNQAKASLDRAERSLDRFIDSVLDLARSFWGLVASSRPYADLMSMLSFLIKALIDTLLAFLWPLVAVLQELGLVASDFLNTLYPLEQETEEVTKQARTFTELNVPAGFKDLAARLEYLVARPGEPYVPETTEAGRGAAPRPGPYRPPEVEIPAWAKELIEGFRGIIEEIKAALQTVLAGLLSFAQAIAPAFTELLLSVIKTFADSLAIIVDWLNSTAAPILIRIFQNLTDFWNNQVAPWITSTVLPGLLDMFTALLNFLNSTVLPFIRDYVFPMLQRLWPVVEQIFYELLDAFKQVISWLQRNRPLIEQWINNMLQEWRNNILKGLDLWKADMQAKAGDFWGSWQTIWQSQNLTFWEKVLAGWMPVQQAFAQGQVALGLFFAALQIVTTVLGLAVQGLLLFVQVFKTAIDVIAGVVRFFWNLLADFIATITFGLVRLPRLQEGGVITKPTVLMAGEVGPEAIIPLPEFNALINALNVPRGVGEGFTLVNEIHLEVDGRELAAIVKRQEVREAIIKGRW
jgi:TP901 family phage tail tape measure protein